MDKAEWRLRIEATSWSGGGRMYWTPEGSYFEDHRVRSREAAADGSSDRLELDLDIVGDWREATQGVSTALRCTDDPDFLFVLRDLDDDDADCWHLGPGLVDWFAVADPDCEAIVEGEASEER